MEDQTFVGPITKVLFFNEQDLLICGSGPLLRLFNLRKGTLKCTKVLPVERIHGIKLINNKGDENVRVIVWGKNKIFLFLVQCNKEEGEDGEITLLLISNFPDIDDWIYCILQLDSSNLELCRKASKQRTQTHENNNTNNNNNDNLIDHTLVNRNNDDNDNDIFLAIGQAHNRIQIWKIHFENNKVKGNASMISQFISQNQSLLR